MAEIILKSEKLEELEEEIKEIIKLIGTPSLCIASLFDCGRARQRLEIVQKKLHTLYHK